MEKRDIAATVTEPAVPIEVAGTSPAGGQSALRQQLRQEPSIAGQEALTRPGGAQQANGVTGPVGRLFNRILGQPDGRADTGHLAFNRQQLRSYLADRLQLAKGEWFRDMKLDGVSDKLMEALDKDGDGKVTWPEFQAFRAEVLAQLAPGVQPGAAREEVMAAATGRFRQVDKSRDNKLQFGELQQGTKSQLPAGTDHADLVAQLGARIALDAVDTDQQSSPVDKRELTLAEWTAAAAQLALQP